MSETTKRYLLSTAITFVSQFLLSFGAIIATLNVTGLEALSWSVVISAASAAARVAVKMTVEECTGKK